MKDIDVLNHITINLRETLIQNLKNVVQTSQI